MKNLQAAVCGLSAFVLLLALCPASWGAEPDQTPGGVRIRVVGPDGKAVSNADVDLTSTEHFGRFGEKLPHVAAKTDDRGTLTFQWPAGNAQINVDVKEHGYGITGLVEVVPDKTLDAPLPPLAPYASIAGAIPNGADAEVTLSAAYMDKPVKVTADKDGNFSAEVRGGGWWVSAKKGGVTIANSGRQIVLMPGDKLRDLKFKPLSHQEQVASTQRYTTGRELPEEQIISWAEGTVRDDAGKPVAGATVYAAAVFHGGMRMYEKASKTTTDNAGHYAIKGDAGLSFFSATLVAHKPGMVPAMAWITLPEPPSAEVLPGDKHPTTRAATPAAPARDFVLTTRGGKLDVTVLFEKSPAPNAFVTLFREGGNLRDTWAAGSGGPAQAETEAIAYPQEKAGADGIAHFEMLPPGRYQAIASTGAEAANEYRQGFHAGRLGAYAVADAIAVRSGESTALRMNIYPQPNTASIRAVRHDGQPLTGDVGIEWGSVNAPSGWSSGIKLDANGLGAHSFDSPGLWHVALRYRDSPVRYSPIPEPYYSAIAVVAASPRLDGKNPAQMTAMRFEGGAVSVELRDIAGKPARGVVEIAQIVGEPTMIGSTDDQGRIRFEHLPSRSYLVKAMIAGRQAPDLGMFDNVPLPPDAELAGRTFVPYESVTLIPNAELHVTLSERPAGYIRGTLRPPPGNSAGQYNLFFDMDDYNRGAHRDYLHSTGEFVIGPFAAGKTHLVVGYGAMRDSGPEDFRQEVAIEAGKLTVVEVKPPPIAARLAENDRGMLIGPGGAESQGTGAESLSGHVYLADGKTPAHGAILHYLVPGHWQPRLAAVTDVNGEIHGRSLWYPSVAEVKEPPGSPEGSVIVAMLPGACGAAVVEVKNGLERPFSISLPKPINLHGTVTLGGAKLTGQTGRFRVLAEYQGKGKLNGLLSVWATPQDDGGFELAGLTPGTYQVQAALDDIWLSSTATVVADDHPLGQINLDIGVPGGPALVKCVDAAGKMMRGNRVIVERPAGPLTTLYWPAEFDSDGAGQTWIPALEAGKHRVRFKEAPGSAEFTIAPLPAGGPVVVDLMQAPH